MAKRNNKRGRRSQDQGSDEAFPNSKMWKQKPKKAIVVTAKTQGQKQYILDILNHDIILCCGPAGSGKTAIAIGIGMQQVCAADPMYEKIMVIRPAKEACDEHIGALPGELGEKMSVYMAPIVDNMQVFADETTIKNLLYENKVDILPVAFARGRSLNNCWIIVDEAQNLTPKMMILILTRMGQNSKLIINGDTSQTDINGASGLEDAISRLEGMDGVAITRMSDADIVRHPMIAEIIRRYSK